MSIHHTGQGERVGQVATHVCGVRPMVGDRALFGPTSTITPIMRPVTTNRNFDICLDRESFRARGLSEAHVGRWDGGTGATREGVFLSMFYAIQNQLEPAHPWNEACDINDRGIAAHVQWWYHPRRHNDFAIHVYDGPDAPTKRGIVVGRNRDEPPFDALPAEVIGYAGADENIWMKVDPIGGWTLGARLDRGQYVDDGTGSLRLNFTYVLSHEVGHFLGFQHYDDPSCIMAPSVPGYGQPRGRWQLPHPFMDQRFVQLSDLIEA